MRQYKRLNVGSRAYRTTYNQETLEDAVRSIHDGMSIRQASRTYAVPFGTLVNKVKGKHLQNPGGVTTLTSEEENALAEHLILVSDWGFPFDCLDLRLLVKASLDRCGRNISK